MNDCHLGEHKRGVSPRLVANRVALAALAAWLAPWHAALAADPTPNANKSYILPYALVVLSIGLGLLVVCRLDTRLDKERKAEKYEG